MLVISGAEPIISRAATDEFLITQTIGDEISFSVAASDVTMVSSIGGLTGGYATGTTYVLVRSNSSTGYTLDLSFSNTVAMQGNTTSSYINNYTPTTPGTPDYGFTIGGTGTPGEFGYTAMASDTPATSGIDQSFLNNGAACGTGSTQTDFACWINPSTTNERIISRTTATTGSGATTTFMFKIGIPPNPSPVIETDTYTATATLTAVNQ